MKKILFVIIACKLATFIVIFLAFNLLPFAVQNYAVNFINHPRESITLQTAFSTWDGQHYLFLSEHGFLKNHISDAFPPLFPVIVGLINNVIGNSFIAGMLVGNTFSILADIVFYLLVLSEFGKKIAVKSLVLLLAFPTSFYFSLIYSESTFFLVAICFFYFLYKKNYPLASTFAFLAPLARQVGVFLIIPLFYFYLFEDKKLDVHDEVSFILAALKNRKTLYLLSPLAGLITYLFFMYISTGNFLEMFHAASFFVSQHSFNYLLNPWSLIHVIFPGNLVLHGFTNSIIDRLFFLGFLTSLPYIYKYCGKTLFLYSVFMGIVFLLSGTFMSYTRHLVIVFPIFIMLAQVLSKKEEFLFYAIFFAFVLFQSLLLIMHSLNYWVA